MMVAITYLDGICRVFVTTMPATKFRATKPIAIRIDQELNKETAMYYAVKGIMTIYSSRVSRYQTPVAVTRIEQIWGGL